MLAGHGVLKSAEHFQAPIHALDALAPLAFLLDDRTDHAQLCARSNPVVLAT
jgi:hypothetical protein